MRRSDKNSHFDQRFSSDSLLKGNKIRCDSSFRTPRCSREASKRVLLAPQDILYGFKVTFKSVTRNTERILLKPGSGMISVRRQCIETCLRPRGGVRSHREFENVRHDCAETMATKKFADPE